MKVTKQVLAKIPSCYAVAMMPLQGRMHGFFASEADDRCLAFDLADLSRSQVVWEHPGGTMSMVPIPGRDGEFLAIQKFYRLWDWEEAQLVWARYNGSAFEVTPLLTLPYLHRFDIFMVGQQPHLLLCNAAAHKTAVEDWAFPGSALWGPLPQEPGLPVDLQPVSDALYQNHGYARIDIDGQAKGLITCANGGFLFTPPSGPGLDWNMEKIIDGVFSDGDMIDIDGDGELEMAAISPFHGNRYAIHKRIGGVWQEVFVFPEDSDFYHVVQAGVLNGTPGFLGGGRGGRERLFFISWSQSNNAFETLYLDEGQGPSNACIYHDPQGDFVLAANRNAQEAVIYQVKP